MPAWGGSWGSAWGPAAAGGGTNEAPLRSSTALADQGHPAPAFVRHPGKPYLFRATARRVLPRRIQIQARGGGDPAALVRHPGKPFLHKPAAVATTVPFRPLALQPSPVQGQGWWVTPPPMGALFAGAAPETVGLELSLAWTPRQVREAGGYQLPKIHQLGIRDASQLDTSPGLFLTLARTPQQVREPGGYQLPKVQRLGQRDPIHLDAAVIQPGLFLTLARTPAQISDPGGYQLPKIHQLGIRDAIHLGNVGIPVGWLTAARPQRIQPAPAPRARAFREILHLIDFRRRYFTARGLHRVFNAAAYRFYRSNSGPPAETDTPFATSATLPHEPADTYADGTWYLAVSYFNGILDSGFLPIGPRGETYLVLEVSGGAAGEVAPVAPLDVRLEVKASGVVKVWAFVALSGSSADPTTWAIAYTTNGSTPAEDSPIATQAMAGVGLQVLEYDLPAQSHGTTVKVRVQTRRGASTYNDGSGVLTATADAQGPSAPAAGEAWPGELAEDG